MVGLHSSAGLIPHTTVGGHGEAYDVVLPQRPTPIPTKWRQQLRRPNIVVVTPCCALSLRIDCSFLFVLIIRNLCNLLY